MMPALDKNLDALERATNGVRREAVDAHVKDDVKRFYHLLLLECAERMTPGDFARSIEVARQQLRRPE